jgi:hypothetical protein
VGFHHKLNGEIKILHQQTANKPQAGDTAIEDEHVDEEKVRVCLVCREAFLSSWAGVRVCQKCKSTSAWRNGALK